MAKMAVTNTPFASKMKKKEIPATPSQPATSTIPVPPDSLVQSVITGSFQIRREFASLAYAKKHPTALPIGIV